MTQMLLFDSPAAPSEFAAGVVAVADCPANEAEPTDTRAQTLENDADRGGMHRMGDLARLVLLRYDLLAQRRAALAAKQSSPCAPSSVLHS